MSIRYKTKGLVFGKEDRLESDRIFYIFTSEFGRLKIFGKAIRKIKSKLRGGIDIFSVSEIEFIQGKSQKTLTDAVLVEKFNNILSSPKRFKTAQKLARILDDFIKAEEKDENLFNLLIDCLHKLNDDSLESKDCDYIYYYFFWNFVSVLGYQPEVQKCAICRQELNPIDIYFSNKEGGIICKKCLHLDASAKKINSDVVKILRLILKKDWQTISKLKIEPLSQELFKVISDEHKRYIIPVRCSSFNSKNNIKYINRV